MQRTRGQDILAEEPSPAFYAGRKLSEVEQALLWSVLQEDPQQTWPRSPLHQLGLKPVGFFG